MPWHVSAVKWMGKYDLMWTMAMMHCVNSLCAISFFSSRIYSTFENPNMKWKKNTKQNKKKRYDDDDDGGSGGGCCCCCNGNNEAGKAEEKHTENVYVNTIWEEWELPETRLLLLPLNLLIYHGIWHAVTTTNAASMHTCTHRMNNKMRLNAILCDFNFINKNQNDEKKRANRNNKW